MSLGVRGNFPPKADPPQAEKDKKQKRPDNGRFFIGDFYAKNHVWISLLLLNKFSGS